MLPYCSENVLILKRQRIGSVLDDDDDVIKKKICPQQNRTDT